MKQTLRSSLNPVPSRPVPGSSPDVLVSERAVQKLGETAELPTQFFKKKKAKDRAELEAKERDGTLNTLETYSLQGYRDEERMGL